MFRKKFEKFVASWVTISRSLSMSPQPTVGRRTIQCAALAGFVLAVLFAPVSAQSVWDQLADYVGLRGEPKPASANVLSEHEIAALDNMTPQNQAILLLERSINHYRGANDQIAKRVDSWQVALLRSMTKTSFGVLAGVVYSFNSVCEFRRWFGFASRLCEPPARS